MAHPEIVIIAALAKANRVIGKAGQLPWHLPEDLKHFRELTTGHPIIVGRKTWEEGLERRSLPHRHTIVVSRSLFPQPFRSADDGHTTLCVVPCLEEAFRQVGNASQIFVIGGASIYEQTLERGDRLELTLVDGEFDGDAFFPPYENLVQQDFQLVHQSLHDRFQINTYRRIYSCTHIG